jgi:hypothetical protein
VQAWAIAVFKVVVQVALQQKLFVRTVVRWISPFITPAEPEAASVALKLEAKVAEYFNFPIWNK